MTVGKASQTIVTSAGATSLPNLTKDNGDFPFALRLSQWMRAETIPDLP